MSVQDVRGKMFSPMRQSDEYQKLKQELRKKSNTSRNVAASMAPASAAPSTRSGGLQLVMGNVKNQRVGPSDFSNNQGVDLNYADALGVNSSKVKETVSIHRSSNASSTNNKGVNLLGSLDTRQTNRSFDSTKLVNIKVANKDPTSNAKNSDLGHLGMSSGQVCVCDKAGST